MRAPVDMSAEERRSGLCRQCGFRPVYESDAILCEDCYEETRQSHQQKIAADNTAKNSGFSGSSRCYSSSGDALRRVPTKAATCQPATNALTMNSERMVIQNPKRAMQPQVSAVSAKQVAERIVGNDCGRN